MTWQQAVELHVLSLEAGNRGAGYIASFRRTMGRFLAWCVETGVYTGDPDRAPLASLLTLDNARGFVLALRNRTSTNVLTNHTVTLGAKTRNMIAKELHSFARACVAERLLDADPLALLQPPKCATPLVEIFTPTHIAALVATVRAGSERTRNLAILCFMIDTGVRASELCELRVEDVSISDHRARVHGKGDKYRWVYFEATTGRALMKYLVARGQQERAELFLTNDGDPLTRGRLYAIYKYAGRAAGISEQVRCSPHTARHTFAVKWLQAHPGAVIHLRELLGHSDLATTQRYARLAETETKLPGPSPVEMLGLHKLVR